jgi:hypothetical protein
MQTILVTIGEDIIARNLFSSDFWPHFKEATKDYKIVFIVQPDKLEYFKGVFQGEHITVIGFKRSNPTKKESRIMSLARSAIRNHTNTWSKMRSYYRGDSGLLETVFKRIHTFLLGGSSMYKRFLRKQILTTEPDPIVTKIFDEYTPSALLATSLTNFDFDVVIAKVAKQRGIPIVGMVRSWDNFSSHGLLRVVPDRLILQNLFLEEMAFKYQALTSHDMPISRVGLPHYDLYFHKENALIPRAVFWNSLGIDPTKKIVLYGAMGEFLYMHEGTMPYVFNDIIEHELKDENIQFVYRAHPKFKFDAEKAKSLPHIIFLPEGKYLDTDGKGMSDTVFLMNLIANADLIVTGASTFAIDSLVIGAPVICVAMDGTAEHVTYWESAKRFFDRYTHFEELIKTSKLPVVYSKAELVSNIKKYLKDSKSLLENRDRVINRFVAPFDGNAGVRLGEMIISELQTVVK